MQKYLFTISFIIVFAFSARAQAPVNPTMPIKSKADSAQDKRDSVKSKPFVPKINTTPKIYHPDSTHSPTKAWNRSVFVPGWGQVYNHQYWKVPIIYTGLTLLVIMYRFNQNAYTEDLTIYRYIHTGKPPKKTDPYYDLYVLYTTHSVDETAIADAVRSYERYRDLAVLLFAASWGIQTIDAYVDAKFKHSYSMDNDFNVSIRPTLIDPPTAQSLSNAFIPGIKVTFTLR
jgi:hypothetical protein